MIDSLNAEIERVQKDNFDLRQLLSKRESEFSEDIRYLISTF